MSETTAADSTAVAAAEVETRVRRIAELLQDKKGIDIVLLDLRAVTDTADFFVLCSGTSDLHVKALAEEVCDQLRIAGQGPWHVEGYESRRWVLVDFVDIVVHIFRQEIRDFYALERLWGDAVRTDVGPEWKGAVGIGQREKVLPGT
ncbi:MAG: ribosome silencing factor [Candidatus Latescibacteria bacterium]|nr:ribosome silencing factor [Candidatus Latescibacterota bacterium]